MGRGLSPLQAWVLRRAAQQSRVYYAEVLAGYFGFKPTKPLSYRNDDGTIPHGIGSVLTNELINKIANHRPLGRTLTDPGGQRFSPGDIGRGRYRAAMSALSRSCARLMDRGLVTCLVGSSSHWAAVEITDAGRAWVEARPEPASPHPDDTGE
jgi:hypothetical protein